MLSFQCDALISEYGKQIIDLLVKKMKPKEVCTALRLCSASQGKNMLKIPGEYFFISAVSNFLSAQVSMA